MTGLSPLVHRFRRARRGGVALLFGLMLLPMIGLVGLAVDYAMANQTYATLYLAANGAVLNAVKIAAAGEAANDANFKAEGIAGGQNWFAAQIGTSGLVVSNLVTSITITPGATVTASFTGSASVPSMFGKLFGVGAYPIRLNTQAVIALQPYLEVVMLLDTSSSMSIGATTADMATLLNNSPCDFSNAFITANGSSYSQASLDAYLNYRCSDGATYRGQPACPVNTGAVTYIPTNSQMGPACPSRVGGYSAKAGPPCAFACHWDGNKPAGLGNDLWAMGRRNGATFRADLVKNATNQVVSAVQAASNPAVNNLSIGIYTFNSAVHRVYPSNGEAGVDWAAATNAVGSPPVPGSGIYTDTGIQPSLSGLTGNNNDTNYRESMTSLAGSYVTAGGSGASAASPKKVLFLVTDGVEDDSYSGARDAMPSASCEQFKNMGYQVYVVYTPYYPLMLNFYLENMTSYVEGTGTNSISYNLQKCSSSTSAADLSTYYLVASDQASLSAALQTFLKTALVSAARYTQ